MPSALIEVRRTYTAEQEVALIEAVHLAMVEAFKIPANDKNLRLVAHAPHRFTAPPDQKSPEWFTQVTIDAFAGRSLDAKRNLYGAIVRNLAALGIPKDHVVVLLREAPKENWGIRGGQAAIDLQLGFKVEV
jgi:phenylpyruvate tautomerase PptA (4-oxalocrotonate tautomerase family)